MKNCVQKKTKKQKTKTTKKTATTTTAVKIIKHTLMIINLSLIKVFNTAPEARNCFAATMYIHPIISRIGVVPPASLILHLCSCHILHAVFSNKFSKNRSKF